MYDKRQNWVFYYDGDCVFCTRLVRALIRIDFFKRIRWLPSQSLKEPPGGLSWGELDSAAYLDTGQRRLHQGFYGIRMLTLRGSAPSAAPSTRSLVPWSQSSRSGCLSLGRPKPPSVLTLTNTPSCQQDAVPL